MTDEMDIVGNEVFPLPVQLFGTSACQGTTQVRQRFHDLRISFVEHDISQDETSAAYVGHVAGDSKTTPLVVFGDEDIILVEPTPDELEQALLRAGYAVK